MQHSTVDLEIFRNFIDPDAAMATRLRRRRAHVAATGRVAPAEINVAKA
jgi:hypothetical protein